MDHRRTDGRGRTVAIAIARLPAKVPVTDPRYGGAILINPGGPGGSGIAQILHSGRGLQTIADSELDPSLDSDENLFSSAKYFDIIGFDPRGVGNTTPGFSCFPNAFSSRNWQLQVEADGMLGSSSDSLMRNWQRNKALAPSCSEMLTTTVDGEEALGEHVNTTPVVEDMVAIIERHGEWREKQGIALQKVHDSQYGYDREQTLARRTRWKKGSEKLLFWGRSYGTILGATFAAMHPGRIERAVLDAVVNIEHYYHPTSSATTSIVDADAIFDRFGVYCDAAGPDVCPMYTTGGPTAITTAIVELLSEIKNWSVPVTASLKRGPEVVTWTDVMQIVRVSLYQPLYTFPLLAQILGELRQGNGSTMADLKQNKRVPSCLSEECQRAGSYTPECTVPGDESTAAILCTDAEGLQDPGLDVFQQSWQRLKNDSAMLGDYWGQFLLECAGWKAKAKWRFAGPFSSNPAHPLLFVSNSLDPVTPLNGAHKTSSFFPGSVVLEQESEGHSTVAAPSLCIAKSIRAYFQSGILPDPGTVCVADEKPLIGPTPSSLEQVRSAADDVLLRVIRDEVLRFRDIGPFLPL